MKPPVLCLGCALARPGRHLCAGARELSVTGGYCQCPDQGCGLPAPPTVRRGVTG